MKLHQKTRQFLATIIGFGIAGALWGWECYIWTTTHDEIFTNPFSFVLGSIALGIFGGLGLTIFSKNIKKILFVIILGTIAWIIGFGIIGMLGYPWLMAIGSILQPIMRIFASLLKKDISSYLNLNPSLIVFGLWVGFFILSLLISLTYTFLLEKKKKIKTILFYSFILSFSSLICPIIGNLIGNNLFNSLFLTYLITFILISLSFGLLLFKFVGIKNES